MTLFPNIILYNYQKFHHIFSKEFNKTYRYCITHTEKEMDMIKRIGVFCADKTCFRRLDHIIINM